MTGWGEEPLQHADQDVEAALVGGEVLLGQESGWSPFPGRHLSGITTTCCCSIDRNLQSVLKVDV